MKAKRPIALMLAATAALSVANACGGDSTALGTAKPGDHADAAGGADGNAGAAGGGAANGGTSSGGSAGSGGSSASGAAGGATGGAGGATGGAGGATGGTAGATGGSGGAGATAAAAGLPCDVPKPPPVPDPSPAELERFALIDDFCVALVRDDCLDVMGGSSFVSQQTKGCSSEDRIIGCEQDQLYEYFHWIRPACDDEWLTAMRCASVAHYDVLTCSPAGMSSSGDGMVCEPEKRALLDCMDQNYPWEPVTGTRATCDYGPGVIYDCQVNCPTGGRNFELQCGGPPGLPIRCMCRVDGMPIGDMNFENPDPFYASDCRAAAIRAADGECVNRLDCCFEYNNGQEDTCVCGSDPAIVNAPSCEAAAQAKGGKVVEICPQFENHL